MARQFVISPDVNVRNITDWFILNTKVQRMTGEGFHATAYTDFADLHAAYAEGRADRPERRPIAAWTSRR